LTVVNYSAFKIKESGKKGVDKREEEAYIGKCAVDSILWQPKPRT
jgi:hypothetical protein